MAVAFDTLIRGGLVCDGHGGQPYVADVGITDGKIAAVGFDIGGAANIVDAEGMLVTPGFIDIHTHYDGQVTWDNCLLPSSLHGVTTVMMGNCGVGFAPCRPSDRGSLIKLMEGVEDIPGVVMETGVPWNWQSFPEYLDFLDSRNYDVDVATQIPHGPTRVFVMGARGADREPARPDDMRAMAEIVKNGVAAGALGFSTTRTMIHRSKDGKLAPTVTAAENELTTIAKALGEIGRGTLQLVDDFHGLDDDNIGDFDMLKRLARASERPLLVTVAQRPDAPERYRTLMHLIDQANDEGLNIKAQVAARPIGLLFSLSHSAHPFHMCPTYLEIAHLPLDERVGIMRKPEVRAKILSEDSTEPSPEWKAQTRAVDDMYELGDVPNYEPKPEDRLGSRAKALGISPLELAYDILLKNNGTSIIFYPAGNFAWRTLDPVLEMMKSRNCVLGVGDGGAHLGMICDASLPTFTLIHWTRDRDGERLTIGDAIKRWTSGPANAIGLLDRGLIAPGYRADINIIDYDKLELTSPHMVHDLPSGGGRLMQEANGIVATFKNGIETYRDGKSTGAMPGRLIRGSQPAPIAA